MDYFDTQNEKLYDFLNQTFNINKHKKWELVKIPRTKQDFLEQLNKDNPLYTHYLNPNKDDK